MRTPRHDIGLRETRGLPAMVIISLVNAASLILAARLLEGVYLEGQMPDKVLIAALTGFVLCLLTYTIEPVLYLLALPINVATFGLFTFVINGIVLYAVSRIVYGFHITGSFWQQLGWATVAALIVGFFRMVVRFVIVRVRWLRRIL